jgi:PTS system glucose-specific IIA component
MFGFKKNKATLADEALYAPVSGQLIPLEEVSDPVFSGKIMGDGFAVEPSSDQVVSPATGRISMVQGHAIGITREDGLEILLHLGIDTVSLNGVPFELDVKVGTTVKGGDRLGKVDWHQVEVAGLEKTTMVLITNTADRLEKIEINYGDVALGERAGQALSK